MSTGLRLLIDIILCFQDLSHGIQGTRAEMKKYIKFALNEGVKKATIDNMIAACGTDWVSTVVNRITNEAK